MIRLQSMLASGVALLAAVLSFSVIAAQDKTLPWDGRFQSLKVATLKDKYLTHILTNRQGGNVDPDQWTTVLPKSRLPAFNDDTGVATLAVDSKAIFGGQTNFRRSELVQNVAGNKAGTTFFRVSLMKKEAYINLYSWQVVFPESHLFELRIDASADPVKLVWYTGGSTETRWSTEFKTKTWYNFGIAVSSGKLALYFSEGDDALVLTKTESYNGDVPANYEFHFGQLTLSNDGSIVKMVEGKQDVLLFNGVSVEDSIPSDLGSSTPKTGLSSNSYSPSAPASEPTTPTATTETAANSSEKISAANKGTDKVTDATHSSETEKTNPSKAPTEDDYSATTTADTPTVPHVSITADALKASNSGCKARRS